MLIRHVLQGIPIHLLFALNPPVGVIRQLHRMFARFFWKNTADKKSRHWVSWDTLCLPRKEGGVGFRSLRDVSNALFFKLWWNLRSKPSQWGSFMVNKYCKKLHPVIAQSRGASTIWKKMVMMRELMEHQIGWQIKKGNSSFWFDNWTILGALYHLIPEAKEEEVEVCMFTNTEGWNVQKLKECLLEGYVQYILKTISPPNNDEPLDAPVWMLKYNGKFSVKRSWEFIRKKEEPAEIFKYIWGKKVPFKMSFFVWRA